ncbi:MAG TPA: hypothetical protein VF079_02045 [Sphingomicrobium sp.]
MDPLVFIALWVLVCLGGFALGLSFYRRAEPRGDISVEQAKRFGRLLMMAATAMLLFLGALWFHGELKGVRL